ncbi:MAG: hypothetical protein IH621_09250 [Krumholzibacteria bacterium]|nr:hypothetical protein [Candidatus Krumholzibacteria bacterium]
MRWPVVLLLVSAAAAATGQSPPDTGGFGVGVWADEARGITCVTGTAGASFPLVAWALVPDGLGLAYVTVRFAFPENVSQPGRPDFAPAVTTVIVTDYPDGTVEWNLVVAGCPSGWVRLFARECTLLDAAPSRFAIRADASMIRDCTFALNGAAVLNELVINDPGCETVPDRTAGWSRLHGRYR